MIKYLHTLTFSLFYTRGWEVISLCHVTMKVIGAVRDLDKMKVVADLEEFPEDSFTAMHVELNSFDSVRKFSEELKAFKA